MNGPFAVFYVECGESMILEVIDQIEDLVSKKQVLQGCNENKKKEKINNV